MEIVVYCIALLVVYYVIQIGLLGYGIFRVAPFVYSQPQPSESIKFTLVVPFKNEAHNLHDLLHSIAALHYDKSCFEVILVNDFSTDDSVSVIQQWRLANPYVQVTILDNVVVSQSSKKDAITRAVTVAKFNWIMTTDADCILPKNILEHYASYLLKNPEKEFLIGGVAILNAPNFLSNYQVIDFASLQAVTLGSYGIQEPFMCNGANLVFSKPIFARVGGYTGVNHIASGDDVFLLQKVLNYSAAHVGYVLSTACQVLTKPVLSWKALIVQRARWGKKTTAYQSFYAKNLGVFTVLTNFGVLFLLVSIFFKQFIWPCIGLLALKFVAEFVFLRCYQPYCAQLRLKYFTASFFIYPVVTLIVSLRMVLFSKNWK